MENADTQNMLVCPYERSHLILKTRMQVHLTRCRRNYPKVNKVTCPFNVSHVLNEPELEFHVTVCPERQSFEHFRNAPAPVTRPTVAPPMPVYQGGENWDDEDEVPTYNPQSYASNAGVLRSIIGAPPSQKKEFRKQERKRLLGMNNE